MRTVFSASPELHAWPDGHGSFGEMFYAVAGVALVEPEVPSAVRDVIPPNGTVLELGSWSSTFAAWLCQQRPDIRVTAVDALIGVPDGRTIRGMLSLINLLLFDNLTWFKGTTSEFGRLAADASWDVVIVDADHSEQGCSTDLVLADRLTRGIILAHDYDEAYPGVQAAVNRFIAERNWSIAQQVGSMVFLRRK
jgi:hypothetical protein